MKVILRIRIPARRARELIRGKSLTSDQRRQVEAAFIYWKLDTTSKTFDEWLNKHAFWFNKKGYLSRNRRYAEPEYLADDPYYNPRRG